MRLHGILLMLLCGCMAGNSQLAAAEFYLSPQGNDLYAGTRQAPWRTWEHAREQVRILKQTNPKEPITVYFLGGRYALQEPVCLDERDSGTPEAPVIYAAAPGETPIFTGSVAIRNWDRPEKFALDRDFMILRFPNEHKDHIYVADLKKAGVSDFGDPTELGLRPELFCDGALQTLARWPNRGMIRAGRAMGQTPTPPNWAGFKGYREGVFEYVGDHPAAWFYEPDVRLGGYWFWDWREEFLRVQRVDPAAHLIYTQPPYHQSGYRDSLRYFALNVLRELDTPGEWYLDRDKGLLFWYPPVTLTPDTEVTLSVLSAPYMLELNGCKNVIIQGLSFQESRGSGILVKEGENCRIEACRVERMGRNGIEVKGGRRHGISGCLLRTLGCSGVRMIGGDRRTLTPAEHFLENTVVEYFSLFKRTYEPALYAEGCGIRASHNRFWYSSSSAMRLEGNDILIEYNDIGRVVDESDDQGGLDIWYNPSYQGVVIRYNRWRDILGGTHCGAAGIRLDDMISGVHIYGNVLENCGSHHFGAIQINGGKDNLVENNLFWKTPAAVSFYEHPWSQQRWDETMARPEVQRKIYEEVDIRSELYLSRYPKLAHLQENACTNEIRHNLLVDSPALLIAGDARQKTEGNHLIASEGRTLQEVCSPEFLNRYGLEPIPLSEMGPRDNPWLP